MAPPWRSPVSVSDRVPATRPALLPIPESALIAELRPEAALLDGADLPTSAAALTALRQLQMERKQARDAAPKLMAMAGGPRPMRRQAAQDQAAPQRIYEAEIAARLDRAASADIGYVERLVAFWTNHFAIGASVGEIERTLVGAFEREAIRPNVLGRFEDMLFAATRHPAMLAYLNNNVSVGPDSPARQAQQARPQREPRARDHGAAHHRRRRRLHPGRRDRACQDPHRLDLRH